MAFKLYTAFTFGLPYSGAFDPNNNHVWAADWDFSTKKFQTNTRYLGQELLFFMVDPIWPDSYGSIYFQPSPFSKRNPPPFATFAPTVGGALYVNMSCNIGLQNILIRVNRGSSLAGIPFAYATSLYQTAGLALVNPSSPVINSGFLGCVPIQHEYTDTSVPEGLTDSYAVISLTSGPVVSVSPAGSGPFPAVDSFVCQSYEQYGQTLYLPLDYSNAPVNGVTVDTCSTYKALLDCADWANAHRDHKLQLVYVVPANEVACSGLPMVPLSGFQVANFGVGAVLLREFDFVTNTYTAPHDQLNFNGVAPPFGAQSANIILVNCPFVYDKGGIIQMPYCGSIYTEKNANWPLGVCKLPNGNIFYLRQTSPGYFWGWVSANFSGNTGVGGPPYGIDYSNIKTWPDGGITLPIAPYVSPGPPFDDNCVVVAKPPSTEGVLFVPGTGWINLTATTRTGGGGLSFLGGANTGLYWRYGEATSVQFISDLNNYVHILEAFRCDDRYNPIISSDILSNRTNTPVTYVWYTCIDCSGTSPVVLQQTRLNGLSTVLGPRIDFGVGGFSLGNIVIDPFFNLQIGVSWLNWPTDATISGTVAVSNSGQTVTIVSSTGSFQVGWISGSPIVINGVTYSIFSVTSSSVLQSGTGLADGIYSFSLQQPPFWDQPAILIGNVFDPTSITWDMKLVDSTMTTGPSNVPISGSIQPTSYITGGTNQIILAKRTYPPPPPASVPPIIITKKTNVMYTGI